VIYMGTMKPEAVDKVRLLRIEADKQAFRLHMLRMEKELLPEPEAVDEGRLPFDLRKAKSDECLDSKQDDYETYRGTYGIKDTRQALIEAWRDGIHSFCITVDTEARNYLPHMYGAANYAVIDRAR